MEYLFEWINKDQAFSIFILAKSYYDFRVSKKIFQNLATKLSDENKFLPSLNSFSGLNWINK